MIEMLEFVLKNNIMEYEEMVCKQMFGIAMGNFKDKAREANISWPILYKRFIDDFFIIYQGDKTQLLRFISKLVYQLGQKYNIVT